MTKEENKILQEIKNDVATIKQVQCEHGKVLCGDLKYGMEGLINQVKRHEKYIEMDKKLKWMISGGIVVLSFLAGIIAKTWDKIFK